MYFFQDVGVVEVVVMAEGSEEVAAEVSEGGVAVSLAKRGHLMIKLTTRINSCVHVYAGVSGE